MFPVLNRLEKTGRTLIKETQQTTQKLLKNPSELGLLSFSCSSKAEDCKPRVKFSFYDHEVPTLENLKMLESSRTNKLEQCYVQLADSCADRKISVDSSKEVNINTTTLLEACAIDSFPNDFMFSLACLLACNDYESVKRFLDRLPQSDGFLQMNILARAIMNLLSKEPAGESLLFLKKTPTEIISLVEETGDNERSLHTFVASHKLSALNSSIDVTRLETDEAYRLETLLGLAKCSDPKLNFLAFDLASRHGIDQWQLHLCTFKHVFASSGSLSASDAKKYVTEGDVVSKLRKKRGNVCCKIGNKCFPGNCNQ